MQTELRPSRPERRAVLVAELRRLRRPPDGLPRTRTAPRPPTRATTARSITWTRGPIYVSVRVRGAQGPVRHRDQGRRQRPRRHVQVRPGQAGRPVRGVQEGRRPQQGEVLDGQRRLVDRQERADLPVHDLQGRRAPPTPLRRIASRTAVGWQYNFTKRTFIIAQYTKVDNNEVASCNFGANRLAIANGQDPKAWPRHPSRVLIASTAIRCTMGARHHAAPFFFSGMPERTTLSLSTLVDALLIAADDALRALSGAATAARAAPHADADGPASPGGQDRFRAPHAREPHGRSVRAGPLQRPGARRTPARRACRAAARRIRGARSPRVVPRPPGPARRACEPARSAVVRGLLRHGSRLGTRGRPLEPGLPRRDRGRRSSATSRATSAGCPRTTPSSRAIVVQMRDDEGRHGAAGRALGGAALPAPVKAAMRMASRVMTGTAYWV